MQLERNGRIILAAKQLSFLLLACTASMLFASRCQAGGGIVGRDWPANQRLSMDRIDHAVWAGLLKKYVDGKGYVAYSRWKQSAADVRALDGYLSQLSRASVKTAAIRESRLAFWINAYNAVTIKGILREYPTSSIRNHTARVFGYNIWDDLRLVVGSQQYSLNQMEHEVLRKMVEPRIHFAIVCASVGCPRLLNEAYTAVDLEKQLTANTQAFFADPAKFRYSVSRREVWVSPILSWFSEDFGPNEAARLKRIAPYLPDAASQQLARSGQAGISLLEYDWGLNDQSSRRTASSSR